jgi:hypothetical protein
MDNMASVLQDIYVDTCYFEGYLWGRKDERENAKSLFAKLASTVRRHPEIKIKVPFIVVGELINNLVRDGFDALRREDISHNFFEKVFELDADIIPPPSDCYYRAKYFIKHDPRLIKNSPTDCFIALCALCDPDSAHLLTDDKSMLESSSLKKIEKEMRENGERNRELKFSQEF